MSKKRIIFMGSPDFSVPALEKLNEKFQIDLVISQPDKKRSRNRLLPTAVKKKALELGLETYEPEKINTKESLEIIDKINPDFIVVIAYGQIIGSHLLENYPDRIINIHGSLLPKYRGAAPMHYALLNGDEKTGVCSMLIEKSMDTGDVLDCRELLIEDDMDIEILHDRLAILAAETIVDTIENYDELYANRSPQDHEKAVYTKKLTKEMGHLDFSLSAQEINNRIRALSVWPRTYVYYGDDQVKIHKINIIDKYTEDREGRIIAVNDQGVFVNCKDKCIVIEELQFPNKRKMAVADYIKGNTIEIGEILK